MEGLQGEMGLALIYTAAKKEKKAFCCIPEYKRENFAKFGCSVWLQRPGLKSKGWGSD